MVKFRIIMIPWFDIRKVTNLSAGAGQGNFLNKCGKDKRFYGTL